VVLAGDRRLVRVPGRVSDLHPGGVRAIQVVIGAFVTAAILALMTASWRIAVSGPLPTRRRADRWMLRQPGWRVALVY
jgi:hypothetical protein